MLIILRTLSTLVGAITIIGGLLYALLSVATGGAYRDTMSLLQNDDNILAYYAYWYEGRTVGGHIWTVENGFLDISYINAADFKDRATVAIRQIDKYAVSCKDYEGTENKKDINLTDSLSYSKLLPHIGIDPNVTLSELLALYPKLLEEVETWTIPDDNYEYLPDFGTKTYIGEDNKQAICAKWIANPCGRFPYAAQNMKGGGASFYSKPNKRTSRRYDDERAKYCLPRDHKTFGNM